MKHLVLAGITGICMTSTPTFAQDGDAAEGEKAFRQCRSCHSIIDASGEDIVKGGKTGPNLFGVPGRVAGSVEAFRYSEYMVTAGEQGLEWNEEDFATYVQDPTAFLKEYLSDDGARGKMTFKLRKEEEAADLWAYLVSVSPEEGS
jgi:cytochrome c